MSAPAAARRSANASLRRIGAAVRQLGQVVDALPGYAEPHRRRDGRTCRCPDPRVVTSGLDQICSYDPDTRTASTDGWDDMGDMEGPTYLECQSCGQLFATPAGLRWH